ncbi:hypothetical protein [Nitratifractor sp.]
MLSNREISQNFEVQISTLYNWRKTKPRLYKYLQNADYNFSMNKEINVLLERFAKEIHGDLTPAEIRTFIESKVDAKTVDEIEEMHRILLRLHHRDLVGEQAPLLFGLYEKISKMNIIEKYIFYKRVFNLRVKRKEEGVDLDDALIREYFEEFLRGAQSKQEG